MVCSKQCRDAWRWWQGVIVSVVVLLWCTEPAFVLAQVQPLGQDTAVVRGSRFSVPIRAVVPPNFFQNAVTVRLVISFERNVLFADSVRGGSGALFQCPPQRGDTQQIPNPINPRRITTRLSVQCNAITRQADGRVLLCAIDFAALGGTEADSVSQVSLDSLFINGEPQMLVAAPPTIIRARGAVIVERPRDVLETNFPNPALEQTSFFYTLSNPATVSFAAYSLLGEVMFESPPIFRQRGRYELLLPTLGFPNGVYALRMTTERGTTRTTFVVMK